MNKNTFPELLLRIGDFLKRNAVYIVGFFIIFIAVWRLRGTYEFAVTPNRGVKLAIYLYFFIGFAAICFTMAKTKKLHLIFLVMTVVLGIGFMLALPLQLIPDESTHYMRAYDIADGKIRYDGININKIKKADLRRSLGIVLQDTNLFTGTVMDNIRYGKLDATDEECIHAAKLANADDFITRLPDGYDTMLTANGGNLSQGQRQLIAIARAAVADPPVMILDEATSSIDTHTEALVQAGMDALMKGRTVFVIAHRLSTVRNSDCIMVLDHGRIIERGTHDDLIAQRGTYYQLYTGAFELD